MRFAQSPALAMALLLLAACADDRAGQGSSVAPASAQACLDLGLAPGTPDFARCQTNEARRTNSAQRGIMDGLFRDVTMSPVR